MHDHKSRTLMIAVVAVGTSLLAGCAGPRPFSAEENTWFNLATGSGVHSVPPPSPYYPPYARPHPAYAPPLRAYPRPGPLVQPGPAPEFVPIEPEQR